MLDIPHAHLPCSALNADHAEDSIWYRDSTQTSAIYPQIPETIDSVQSEFQPMPTSPSKGVEPRPLESLTIEFIALIDGIVLQLKNQAIITAERSPNLPQAQ